MLMPERLPMSTKILLIDDEENVRKSIASYLNRRGFTVTAVACGEEALHLLPVLNPALLVLDVQMPTMDGMEVCREIRSRFSYIPTIMISGVRKEAMDRVVALELCADKYLVKPFELPLLLAEIHSLLRMAQSTSSDDHSPGWLPVDDYLRINRMRREVYVGSDPVVLTTHEFDLLLYLYDHANIPCSRDDLIEHVWKDTSGGVSDQAVTSCIKRLRKKIERNPLQPTYIHSIYGWGYKFHAATP